MLAKKFVSLILLICWISSSVALQCYYGYSPINNRMGGQYHLGPAVKNAYGEFCYIISNREAKTVEYYSGGNCQFAGYNGNKWCCVTDGCNFSHPEEDS